MRRDSHDYNIWLKLRRKTIFSICQNQVLSLDRLSEIIFILIFFKKNYDLIIYLQMGGFLCFMGKNKGVRGLT